MAAKDEKTQSASVIPALTVALNIQANKQKNTTTPFKARNDSRLQRLVVAPNSRGSGFADTQQSDDVPQKLQLCAQQQWATKNGGATTRAATHTTTPIMQIGQILEKYRAAASLTSSLLSLRRSKSPSVSVAVLPPGDDRLSTNSLSDARKP